jgi:hypothetical protein
MEQNPPWETDKLVKKFPAFLEPESSQELTSGPYPISDESNQHSNIVSLPDLS